MGKRIRKANKNAGKGGRKLFKKGQSSSSNPSFNIHRLEAKKRVTFGVRGQGNLTEAKLAIHNRLRTESQCDENEEAMSVGGETAMTAFTNCSLPTFERFLKSWNSNSFVHKEMLAILSAVTDVLKTKEGKETDTEYFAALMTTLDVVETEESLTAVLSLLLMVAKRLNESVLKLHFKEVCKRIIQILLNPSYMKSEQSSLLRNSLLILHCFLKANTSSAAHSEEEETGINFESVVRCVLEYITHHKPKVRKAAHEIICSLLQENTGKHQSGAKLVAEHCIDLLEKQGGPSATKEVFYVLILLQNIFDSLPKSKIKAVCETIFKVMTLSNAALASNCLKTLQCLFNRNPEPEHLPSDMNARIINVLYNYEPNVNESQSLVGWLQVMESSFINLRSLDERLCLQHLPAFTSRAVKCWLSGKQEVLSVVEATLRNLVAVCIDTDSPVFQQLLLEDPVNNPIHKMFHSVEGAMSYEYHKAWKHVLRVLATFFGAVGKCCYTVMMKCLRNLADMHEGYNFPHLQELERALGAAVQGMGPAIVIEAIPLSIDSDSAQPNFPRSWMLPLLRDNIKKTQLKFFTKYFLPLANKLRNKVIRLQEEQRVVESKLYDTIYSQIWSMLPGFCNEPTDIKESFRELAQMLGEVLKAEPMLRPTVLSALRQLIRKNLENDENREELSKYAKNYLPILFNLYTTESKDKAEERVRLTAYEAIRDYLQLASKELCDSFFSRALEKLSAEESGTFMQHALLDICKAMLLYLDAPRVQQLYELCKPLLVHNNRTTQKKSFGVMNEICSCRTEVCGSFVREHFEELRPLLCKTSRGMVPATKALRLNCLQSIANRLTKEDMDTIILISAEAVICTKENSIKARAAAFELLVALGHTLKRIVPGDGKAALKEYMKILLAGLAGSTHLISATILSIGRVMFEFKSDMDLMLIDLLVHNMCLLLTSKAREVVMAVLSFFKILFSILPPDDLLQHVEPIVQSVNEISEINKKQVRFKAKELFTRLIRKFGYEMIYKLASDGHKKQLSNIRKLEARKQKKREYYDEEEEGIWEPKKGNTFEDILADSDDELWNDEEVVMEKKRKRPKRSGNPMIEEHDEDDIVDFMDPAVNKRLLTKQPQKPSGTKRMDPFPISEDGRLIIQEEEEKPKKEKEDDEEELPLKELGLDKKKKRKHEDSDEDDNILKGTDKGGIRRFEKKQKKRLPGEEFKAPKAGGDVKRGKLDPYAYVPFNRLALNKRKSVKLKGQYKNIVQAAKKGANAGVKRRMRAVKKQKKKRH